VAMCAWALTFVILVEVYNDTRLFCTSTTIAR
jgi:hypothetical protein